MRVSKLAQWIAVGIICLAATVAWAKPEAKAAEATPAASGKASEKTPEKIENSTCLACHGNKGFEMPGADGKMRSLFVNQTNFGKSVHAKRACQECHKDITEIPHKKGVTHKVSCVSCHQELWEAAQYESQEFPRLGVVIKQIERYMKSVHARPNKEDQSRTNATCYNCHDAHYVYPKGSPERAEWRKSIPNVCGKCHSKERDEYLTSVHANEILKKGNLKAAVCSDCHTTHDIDDPTTDSMRLVITKNCGNCHEENLKSYLGTYHGQVNRLGYAYTAKCFDCHSNHDIKRVSDADSTVSPENRLDTCRKCHMGATIGFTTFSPHGNTHDRARYPYMWITSKFMIALLFGVFAFFWTHSLLWFYREYRERHNRTPRPHVLIKDLPNSEGKYFRRFAPLWRLAHLVFALSVMMLVLTGMAVLYGQTGWAKVVMQDLGGPRVAGIIHRASAAIMLGIFFMHLVYLAFALGKKWKTFKWLGPNSMVPRMKDFTDAVGMFKWFFGLGPRPTFERWTYWEKFDYWAVFWGMAIIGGSGLMLSVPNITASVLPGWIFNVATIVHGEEAILAAVFLFTVHFFNNHLRPDKFPPPDIVMFTGAVSLEEFKHEHTEEYNRLVETGEIKKYLVDAPTQPMTKAARALGITLLTFGFTLLVLVVVGFVTA